MTIKVCDISYANKGFDPLLLKADNVKALIIRTGYLGKTDDEFKNNMLTAINNGFDVGAYTYLLSQNTTDARQEAIETALRLYPFRDYLNYPVFADLEDKRILSLSKETKTAIVRVFCDTLESLGFKAGIYTNPDFYYNRFITEQLEPYDIWLAHWTQKSKYVDTIHPGMWQYGKTLYGNKEIDTNVSYIDYPVKVSIFKSNFDKVNKSKYGTS